MVWVIQYGISMLFEYLLKPVKQYHRLESYIDVGEHMSELLSCIIVLIKIPLLTRKNINM